MSLGEGGKFNISNLSVEGNRKEIAIVIQPNDIQCAIGMPGCSGDLLHHI